MAKVNYTLNSPHTPQPLAGRYTQLKQQQDFSQLTAGHPSSPHTTDQYCLYWTHTSLAMSCIARTRVWVWVCVSEESDSVRYCNRGWDQWQYSQLQFCCALHIKMTDVIFLIGINIWEADGFNAMTVRSRRRQWQKNRELVLLGITLPHQFSPTLASKSQCMHVKSQKFGAVSLTDWLVILKMKAFKC